MFFVGVALKSAMPQNSSAPSNKYAVPTLRTNCSQPSYESSTLVGVTFLRAYFSLKNFNVPGSLTEFELYNKSKIN